MRGGKFLASGADTCVFNPKVACANDSTRIFWKPGRKPAFVSRITYDAFEVDRQRELVQILHKISTAQPDIYTYFNLADSVCTPAFVPSDQQEKCNVLDTTHPGLQNLITPKQDATLYKTIEAGDPKKTPAFIADSLRKVMIAMTYVNEHNYVHADTHFGNLGWRGKQLVIFDWGRAISSLASFKDNLKAYSKRDLSGRLHLKSYCQHMYSYSMVDPFRKTIDTMPDEKYLIFMRLWDTYGLLGSVYSHKMIPMMDIEDMFEEMNILLSMNPPPSPDDVSKALRTQINKLFKHPQAPVSPKLINNDPGLMPAAQAKAGIALIAPAAAAPADPKARARERALNKKKETCRKLLGIAGGQRFIRKTRRHGRHGV